MAGLGVWLLGAPAHDVPERWKYPHRVRGGVMGPTDYQSANRCALCHDGLYKQWLDNHAMSWKRPTFQLFYQEILETTGKPYEKECLTCHAPISVAEETYMVASDIEKEGVTCDFCHTIVVKEGKQYESRPSLLKRGPRHPAFEGSHGVAYDTSYMRSEFCAVCHEWQSNDILILDEVRVWAPTRFAAEGQQCQTCHMPRFQGYAAERGGFERPDVASHEFLGSDDVDFVRQALDLEVEFERDPEFPEIGIVRVIVRNKGVAHMTPAGLSWKRYDLIVRIRNADGSRVYWSQMETMKRELADRQGNPTFRDWEAVSVLSDTRLRPEEERVYTYRVDLSDLPTDEPFYVSAQLFLVRMPKEIYQMLGESPRRPVELLKTFTLVK